MAERLPRQGGLDTVPLVRFFWAVSMATTALACSEECVEVSTDCAPLYAPELDEIFTRTLAPTCAAGGSSCHSATGAEGGLAFTSPEESHRLLLEEAVVPGDPGCSELVVRLESDDPGYQMPPGGKLSAEERCAIVQWIAAGAPP